MCVLIGAYCPRLVPGRTSSIMTPGARRWYGRRRHAARDAFFAHQHQPLLGEAGVVLDVDEAVAGFLADEVAHLGP
jgi:hypothetical protein